MKTLENWQEDVLNQELVLVEFCADWSKSSTLMKPVLEELERDVALLSVVKVPDQDKVTAELPVQAIPTMMLFKNGEYVWAVQGAKPKAVLIEKIAPYV